jgi:hypothetical protein
MRLHPLCKLFPQINDSELADLAKDIKANGMRDPIVTLDGEILDGQNRFRACEMAGVKPQFDPYIGDNPVGYVISKNIARRHLDASQRAMIAAELSGGKWGGNHTPQQDANLRLANPVITDESAAKLMNASERSLVDARAVKTASPELAAEVRDGKVKLNAAKKAAKASPKALKKALAEGTDAVKKLAKKTASKKSRKGIFSDDTKAKAQAKLDAIAKEPERPHIEMECNPIDIIEEVYRIHQKRWNDPKRVPAPRTIVDAIVKAFKLAGFKGTVKA